MRVAYYSRKNSSWMSSVTDRNKTRIPAAMTLIEGPRQEENIDEEKNYTGHHTGRHVCSNERNVPKMVKTSQSYCKPVYRRYTTRCRGNETLICEAIRLVYETAYRDVVKTKLVKETSFACCPGWAQETKFSHGCLKAICKTPCQNDGTCSSPDTCTCLPGYYGKVCEHDVNECSDQKPCDQLCYNIPGSYFCTCRDGFTLQADRQSCKKIAAADGSEMAFEAKDLEYEYLNERITKIEKILEAEKYAQNLTPKNLNSKMDDVLKSIFSLKSRIESLEQKKKERDFNNNSLHRFKNHGKKYKHRVDMNKDKF